MYDFMYGVLEDSNHKVIYILTIMLVVTLFDYLAGWLNAFFNKEVSFSSSKAIYGLIRKIMIFMLFIVFVPMSALIPAPVGQTAYWILSISYVVTELYSLLSHLGLTKDDKQGQLFHTFISALFNRKEEEK